VQRRPTLVIKVKFIEVMHLQHDIHQIYQNMRRHYNHSNSQFGPIPLMLRWCEIHLLIFYRSPVYVFRLSGMICTTDESECSAVGNERRSRSHKRTHAVRQCGAALASTRRAHRASRRDSARTSNAAPSYRMHMHTHTIGCRPYIRRPRRVRVTLVERVCAVNTHDCADGR
jgi:hypothetical protein